MKKSHILIALLLVFLMAFTSCVGQTKAERNRTRVENAYDGFQKSLMAGTLPDDSSDGMLVKPLDEKLLQDAAREYPRGGKGTFYFDTVKFSADGDLMFINTEDIQEVGHPWGIVQEKNGKWYLYDGEYVFPLVSQQKTAARAMKDPVNVPDEWITLAESQVRIDDGSVLSTFYFINVTKDEMVGYFDTLLTDGVTKSVDESLGDVSYRFVSDGRLQYEVLVWQEIPGIPVLDIADYRKTESKL